METYISRSWGVCREYAGSMPGGTIETSRRESEGKRGTETEREVGDAREV